jgi:hypothetical protein
MSKDRVETFSDGVFAIILTLLVLELRAPNIADHSSLGQYAAAMAPLIPKVISFVLTFYAFRRYAIELYSLSILFSFLNVYLSLACLFIVPLFILFQICFKPQSSHEMKEYRKWKSNEMAHSHLSTDRLSILRVMFALTPCSKHLIRRARVWQVSLSSSVLGQPGTAIH